MALIDAIRREAAENQDFLRKWGKPLAFVAGALVIIGLFFGLTNKPEHLVDVSKNQVEADQVNPTPELQKKLDALGEKQDMEDLKANVELLNSQLIELESRFDAMPKDTGGVSISKVRREIDYAIACHEGQFRNNPKALEQDPNCIPYHVGR